MSTVFPRADAAIPVVNEVLGLWRRLAELRRREIDVLDRDCLGPHMFGEVEDWEFFIHVGAIPHVAGSPLADDELDCVLEAIDAERATAFKAVQELLPDLYRIAELWPVEGVDLPGYFARWTAISPDPEEVSAEVMRAWRKAGRDPAPLERGWAQLLRRGVGKGEEYNDCIQMLTRLLARLGVALADEGRPPVQVRGQGKPPLVWGKPVDPLNDSEFDMVEALERAWPADRMGPDLTEETHNKFPGRVLTRLAEKPLRRDDPAGPKWSDVLKLPGKDRRGGYGFRDRREAPTRACP